MGEYPEVIFKRHFPHIYMKMRSINANSPVIENNIHKDRLSFG